METKTVHAATPWKLDNVDHGNIYIVADQGKAWDNPVICNLYEDVTPEDSVTIGAWLKPMDNAEANAAFIVRACNAHADLLNTLRIIDSMVSNDHGVDGHDLDVISVNIRVALTKAEGKEE